MLVNYARQRTDCCLFDWQNARMKIFIPSEGGPAAQPASPTWSGRDSVAWRPSASHAATDGLRVVRRPDLLTAQKVEVSIILQAMLGTAVAATYLADNEVKLTVSMRVLTKPGLRRGRHDANGIACSD